MKVEKLYEAGLYLLIDIERQFSDSTEMYYSQETIDSLKTASEKIIVEMVKEIDKYLIKQKTK